MRILMLTVVLAAVALGGCPSVDGGVEDRLPPELESAIDAFYSAIESGDVETRIALLSDDIVIMPNHWRRSRGKETVAASFRASSDAVFEIKDREVVDSDVSGDLAYTVNAYWYTYHLAGDDPQWHKTKNVHVWEREVGGEWKLKVDIWNSDVPLAAFGEE